MSSKTVKNKNGFTIVELLIVIIVIAILAAIIIIAFSGMRQKATESTLRSDLRSSANQLAATNVEDGSYPNTASELKKSEGTSLEYTYVASENSYCLSASSPGSSSRFHVSSALGNVQAGVCDGHDDGTGQSQETGSPTVYEVGDSGPAGGIVFYADTNDQHPEFDYLEAASSDQSAAAQWGCAGINVNGARTWSSNNIGYGQTNTTHILAANCTTTNGTLPAANIAAGHSQGGASDWFLPSKDELDLMYTTLYLQGLGGFTATHYWSSAEHRTSGAVYTVYFVSGTNPSINKSSNARVRAIRAF